MIIKKRHFEYLVNQHGRIAHHADNFPEWELAYEESLAATFKNIKPVLPTQCDNILDIGSGLGGIDIFLSKHYLNIPAVHLLDGNNGSPEVVSSFVPHNDWNVADDFLRANGVYKISPIAPGELFRTLSSFDLVVSFAAYGFHIHPGNYLDDLKKVVHDKTVIILEVRRTKDDWLRLFVEAFGNPVVLEREKKYVRVAFRA